MPRRQAARPRSPVVQVFSPGSNVASAKITNAILSPLLKRIILACPIKAMASGQELVNQVSLNRCFGFRAIMDQIGPNPTLATLNQHFVNLTRESPDYKTVQAIRRDLLTNDRDIRRRGTKTREYADRYLKRYPAGDAPRAPVTKDTVVESQEEILKRIDDDIATYNQNVRAFPAQCAAAGHAPIRSQIKRGARWVVR